jgi:hypothetical protein
MVSEKKVWLAIKGPAFDPATFVTWESSDLVDETRFD